MALLNDVADRMAARTLRLIEQTGDENLEKKVADEIGASSPTLQEAFSTALRILKAEARAKRYIEKVETDAGVESTAMEPERPLEVPEAPEAIITAPPAEPKPSEEAAAEERPKILPKAKKYASKADPKALPDLGVTPKSEKMDVADGDDIFGFDESDEMIALPGPVEGRGKLA